jgi:radical SAM enzyme (TIGR01210 family)
MLHDKEVPPAVRRKIFALVAQTDCKRLYSETHPTTVTPKAMAECVGWLPGKTFVIELGAESMDDFVRKWCIHKDFDTEELQRAVRVAHAAGAQCALNLMVGAAFLAEREAIDYGVSSARRALEIGADSVVLFACRVKEHTLIGWLHDRGLYAPPSLLCLAEVILALRPEERDRLNISWVTSKPHPGRPVDLQPEVHHTDAEEVYEAFRRFDQDRDVSGLEALRSDPVYARWLEGLAEPLRPLVDRIEAVFDVIGENLLPSGWWTEWGREVVASMRSDWTVDHASQEVLAAVN